MPQFWKSTSTLLFNFQSPDQIAPRTSNFLPLSLSHTRDINVASQCIVLSAVRLYLTFTEFMIPLLGTSRSDLYFRLLGSTQDQRP